ncbi:MAG: replication-relaxation family protein, partial [Actinobacteria bacterium]|nr:replication-relaxation family protein [Actinomycetota bacterium]
VLRRLVAWRVLTPFGRRIGGARRGSARAVYALDTAGQRLAREQQAAQRPTARVRRPAQVGERFLAHALAVSELYVMVSTTSGKTGLQVAAFEVEPGCWWPDGLGGWLKPDAYLALDTRGARWHSWVEIDRATESLPTLTRKLDSYLNFYQRGQLGPHGVMPRVLISTITEQRLDAIRELVQHLPDPAGELFVVTLDRDAVLALLGSLKE